MPLLSLEGLHAGYGAIRAVRGISLEVDEGEIVCLIGSNGAGKSTTLRAISGLIRATSGAVRFRDREITNMAPHRVAAEGIAHVPEGRGIFSRLTVTENLEMGAYLRPRGPEVARDLERANQTGGTLSGGEQQMLAIGRALMARPALLLLDEPSMGLSPILTQAIFERIREINREGTTILLVEQNATSALAISNRGYVVESGEIVLSGTGAELTANDRVRRAYLGEL